MMIFDRPRPIERVLVLGLTPLSRELLQEAERDAGRRRVIVGLLDEVAPAEGDWAARLYLGPVRRLPAVVDERRPHRILVGLAPRLDGTPMAALLDSYVSGGVAVEDLTEFYERITGQVALESLTPMRVVASGRFRPVRSHRVFSRLLSLATALVGLAALLPLLAIIAVAIKVDSPGPALFAQERVGARGRPFTLLKFRTMVDGGVRRSEWEGDNRDRVTRVGRWLRRFRLDELPQLVNILRGEMNLVGPRPHPVSNMGLFTLVARNLNELTGEAISCYALRLVVPPGLTGWAQVRYRYANNLDEEIEKLRYDLYYVKHLSPWLDLRILLETIGVLGRACAAGNAPAGAGVAGSPVAERAACFGIPASAAQRHRSLGESDAA